MDVLKRADTAPKSCSIYRTSISKGHKIPTIENLGAARNQECFDFSDNDITLLGNFPLSPRVQTLLCARNRINQIQPTLAASLPSLTTLVLTQNNFTELAELVPLRGFKSLTHVSLIENSVTKQEVSTGVDMIDRKCGSSHIVELSIVGVISRTTCKISRLSKGQRHGANGGN